MSNDQIILATTTSVRDAGLLDYLLPHFQGESGYTVKVVAVGSGQAMELGRRGEADILILHDPAGEERFVTEGFGLERRPLMRNEFIIVGPPDDPAGVRGLTDAPQALAGIAMAGGTFVSRGDRSGTHVKEDTLWGRSTAAPDPAWHLESGQGMSATLQIANELRAYTLSDLGTFLRHAAPLDLIPLAEGDSLLHNPYHVILTNPKGYSWVNHGGAQRLHAFLLSDEVQEMIGEYGREEHGRALFAPAHALPLP